MDLFLKEKIIIVTGGARGIGKAIVILLAEEGAIPVIIGKDLADNEETVKQILASGKKSFHVVAELTDPLACKEAVDKIRKQFGRIDGVVNNAGLNDGVRLEGGTYEEFMLSLHRNLVHYFLVVQEALPELKAAKGAIVNIASKTSETGQGNTSAYAASNGGRNALTREWAVDLLKYNIRVNSVVVSECFTPQYAEWIVSFENHKEKLDSITKNIPFEKRMTTPEEIANMVVFLLSQRSSHTTGQLIHVDGGYVHLDRALANT